MPDLEANFNHAVHISLQATIAQSVVASGKRRYIPTRQYEVQHVVHAMVKSDAFGKRFIQHIINGHQSIGQAERVLHEAFSIFFRHALRMEILPSRIRDLGSEPFWGNHIFIGQKKSSHTQTPRCLQGNFQRSAAIKDDHRSSLISRTICTASISYTEGG